MTHEKELGNRMGKEEMRRNIEVKRKGRGEGGEGGIGGMVQIKINVYKHLFSCTHWLMGASASQARNRETRNSSDSPIVHVCINNNNNNNNRLK